MQRQTKLSRLLIAGIGITVAAGIHFALPATGQPGEGWTSLFDGKNLGDWDQVGETNWRVEDGAIVADKRTSKDTAHLVSKQKYKDFQLYVEFWASDDANSGIYMRCQEPTKIGGKSCYEANIYDQFSDATYGTGSIVYFAETNTMPKAGGKWNTFEITAKGRQLTVVLNGEKTADIRNGMFIEGPFTLQHGAGTIKFRKIAIKPI